MHEVVAVDHFHECKECGAIIPGFRSKCKEPREVLCYKCLAATFPERHEWKVAFSDERIAEQTAPVPA